MITVILPAKDIPLDSMVTKKSGAVLYKLVDKLTIFEVDKTKRVIGASEGCLFLLANGYVNAIPDTTKLGWTLEEEELLHYLEDRLRGVTE